MDSETLTFLLRGGHISMPDRIKRGLWPHSPLRFCDVVEQLVSVLENERWFPVAWHPHTQGRAVYEGGVIERKSPKKYIYRTARSLAVNPFALAQVTEKVFASLTGAARHYLKWDMHLPGDLDGWKVVE